MVETRIPARHLLFGSFEKPYARGNSGYGVYYSGQLEEDEIEQIKRKIGCFPSLGDFTRRQYFQLNAHTYVFVESTGFPAQSEYKDIIGFRAAYIAHCVVLDDDEFAALNFNPFWVFQQFDFAKTPQEIVDRFGQDDPAHQMVVLHDSYRPPRISKAHALDLSNLSEVSSQYEQLLNIRGKVDNVETFIEALFWVSSFESRRNNSFDTYGDGCSNSNADLKIYGHIEHSLTKHAYSIQIEDGHAWEIPTVSSLEVNALANFIVRAYLDVPRDFEDLFYLLDRHLLNKPIDFEKVSASALGEFVKIAKTHIQSRLTKAFRQYFDDRFSEMLGQLLIESREPEVYLKFSATTSITVHAALHVVQMWFVEHHAYEDSDSILRTNERPIRSLAENGANTVVQFWLHALLNKKRELEEIIAPATKQDIEEIVRISDMVKPLLRAIGSDERLLVLFSQAIVPEFEDWNDRLFAETLQSLIRVQVLQRSEPMEQRAYQRRIGSVDREGLSRIEKTIKKEGAPSFIENAAAQRRAALGDDHTLFSRMKGMFKGDER